MYVYSEYMDNYSQSHLADSEKSYIKNDRVNTTTYHNSIKEMYCNILLDKTNEFLKEEVFNSAEEKQKILSNIFYSSLKFNSFFDTIKEYFLIEDFHPEIELDYDGEISLEWFGRLGAGAIITFGSKDEIYFNSIFHGQSQKHKLFFDKNSIELINKTLKIIYFNKKRSSCR